MKITPYILSLSFLLFSAGITAQEATLGQGASESEWTNMSERFGVLSLTGGAGVMVYSGNLSKQLDFKSGQIGYSFELERRLIPALSVSLNGVFGKVAYHNYAFSDQTNFSSDVMQGGLMFTYHFNNAKMLPERGTIQPFIAVGFNYMVFDPYTDMYDKNGLQYFYWEEGGLYDRPEDHSDAANAIPLTHDYVYETKLTAAEDYARNAFVIPVKGGLSMYLTHNLDIRFEASYNLVLSEYLDNSPNGKNDGYLYGSVSLSYAFGKSEFPSAAFADVDFDEIEKGDADDDGVLDTSDKCPATPKGVKVNSQGCPEDKDWDGVPDYLDKEPNSPKGSKVDSEGKAVTDETLEKQRKEDEKKANDEMKVIKSESSGEKK